MSTRKTWKVEYWQSDILPGVFKYRHAGTQNVVSTATTQQFQRLRAWWDAEYGEGSESTNAKGHTVLTFVPQAGKHFRLTPATDWGKVRYY